MKILIEQAQSWPPFCTSCHYEENQAILKKTSENLHSEIQRLKDVLQQKSSQMFVRFYHPGVSIFQNVMGRTSDVSRFSTPYPPIRKNIKEFVETVKKAENLSIILVRSETDPCSLSCQKS
jgi:hypothetical protein